MSEPVCSQYQDKEGNWKPFINADHEHATRDSMAWHVRDLYTHPDPRVAELEAVLRECREALVPYMKYVDGTSVLNHPAQCVEKIDEVLNVPDSSRTA